jgi:hypothetical protein
MTGKSQRAFVPTTALANSVNFDEEMMHVLLTDGRRISVPILWFPVLREATPDQRTKYEIAGGGTSLHWPELDEELSMAGLMAVRIGRELEINQARTSVGQTLPPNTSEGE